MNSIIEPDKQNRIVLTRDVREAAGFTPGEGQLFTGIVATFADPGTNGNMAEYATQITWGDGAQTSGTVAPLNGDQLGVSKERVRQLEERAKDKLRGSLAGLREEALAI